MALWIGFIVLSWTSGPLSDFVLSRTERGRLAWDRFRLALPVVGRSVRLIAISRFARMRAPVVAAVNGTAAGAGFSMMCATDLAIVADSAKLTMAYTGAGLSPDGSSSY